MQGFCDNIDSDHIRRDIRRLVYSVNFIHTAGFESICQSTQMLDHYQSVDNPLRMQPDALSRYMATFSLAKHQEAGNLAWTHILRQRLILHEYRLARIVDNMEGTLCDEIFARGTFLRSPSGWIETLLRDIHVKLVIKLHLAFSSSSYIHGDTLNVRYEEPDWAFQARSKSRKKRPSDTDLYPAVATYLGHILRRWLGLPSSFITRGRCQLVDILLAKFDTSILYTHAVWKIHRELPRYLFKNPPRDYHTNTANKDRPYDDTAMSDFAQFINFIDDEVADNVNTLGETYAAFVSLTQAYNLQVNTPTPGNYSSHFAENLRLI